MRPTRERDLMTPADNAKPLTIYHGCTSRNLHIAHLLGVAVGLAAAAAAAVDVNVGHPSGFVLGLCRGLSGNALWRECIDSSSPCP